MARQETVISVFAASPSDLKDERALLENVIRELNDTWSASLELRLELLRWETHTYPGMGKYPQNVINQQIGDNYDIFIGLMGRKFGSATMHFGSGTEEEFVRARDRHRSDGDVNIMMYFKNEPFTPTLQELDEYRKVLEFREDVGNSGAYYFSFDNLDALEKLLRNHLSKVVQKFKLAPPNRATPYPAAENTNETEVEIGLFDAIDAVENLFEITTSSILEIGNAISDLAERTNLRTAELEALPKDPNGNTNRQDAKKIISAAARDLDRYTAVVEPNLKVYQTYFLQSINALITVTELSVDFGGNEAYEAHRQTLIEQISQFGTNMTTALSGAKGFRSALAATPRVTSDFNAARRKAVNTLDAVIFEFEANLRFLTDLRI